MNSNFFTILLFISYFCCVSIAEQSSTVSPLFPHTKNSSADSRLYCLGGKNENSDTTYSVSALNTTTNKWESVTEMSTGKSEFGATAIGEKIYVCGGYDGKKFLSLMEVYDCESNTWTELAPIQHVQCCFGMTALNNHIYVAGGWDGSKMISSVLKYSPETNTWTEVKSMNEARDRHELVTLHSSIYAVGGQGTKTIERYSTLIDEWTYVASTKHNHSYLGATSHQNKIYVLGEEGFEVFDPKFDTWQDLPSLDIGAGLQLVSINDKLLAVGVGYGNNKGKASKSVYEFDTTNNSWIHRPDMDVPRILHRAVVVNF